MLGNLLSYAASRAAGDAVDGLARRIVWGGLAAVLMLFALGIGLIVSYWLLEPRFGSVETALGLAAACAVAGLVAMTIPSIIESSRKAAPAALSGPAAQVTQTAAAVREETAAAVDYFGAMQVVASAFMFGLGAARQIRRKA